MMKKTRFLGSGLMVFAAALALGANDRRAQGATPLPLDKATVSAEVAKRTLMKSQISAPGRPPDRRRLPRVRTQSAGRAGHLRDLRARAERRHRRRARDGRRAADWRRDRTAQGEDGAVRADAVERRRAALQQRGRPADSAGSRQGIRPGLLLRRRRAADRRPGSADWRDRRRRREHGRAVRLSGAHEGPRASAAAARPPAPAGGAAPADGPRRPGTRVNSSSASC